MSELHNYDSPPGILLVDDDYTVLEVTALMLKRLGCRVHIASDLDQAVKLMEARGGEIDALIIDYSLPKINGMEARQILCQQKPGLRTIIISGYTAAHIQRSDCIPEDCTFLQKPFGFAELRGLVSELMFSKMTAFPIKKSYAGA